MELWSSRKHDFQTLTAAQTLSLPAMNTVGSASFSILTSGDCSFLLSSASRTPSSLVQMQLVVNSESPQRVFFLQRIPINPLRTFRSHFHTSNHRLASKDWYQVLGVPRDADAKVIKQAYFKMAKKCHPDSHPNDKNAKDKFQEVSEAYEVLSDEDKKREYDVSTEDFGLGGKSSKNAGRGAYRGSFRGTNVEAEDLFERVFGKYSEFAADDHDYDPDNSRSEKGRDEFGSLREISVSLSFVEAARGMQKVVDLIYDENCGRCNGKRIEPNSRPIKCNHCSGSGIETINRGPFNLRQTCRHCHGARTISKDPCTTCRGKGIVKVKRSAEIQVPAGVEDGQTIRTQVDGKEFFIKFTVEKSNKFRRQGSDIHSDISVSLSQAVLGGIVRVSGLYDDYRLNVPSGTQSHEYIVLRGKGMKRVHSSGHGDHYVHVKIKTPTKLSPEQEALLSAFAELEEDVEGTITGLTEVSLKSSSTPAKRRVVSDDAGYVAEIRRAIGRDDDEADGLGRS